jgi:glycerol uptake facilitator-like aquaporin
MFAMPLVAFSLKVRTGNAQWLAEAVAAFGLIATILGGLRFQKTAIPWLVGLYITAAYWFTASTSFANPAVAIARSLTNTFSGIRPVDLPGFIIAELLGAVASWALMAWLLETPASAKELAAYDRDDLPQSELRNLAERAGHDPAERSRA